MNCKVALGGTFDKLHLGHRNLLDAALNLKCEIIIGVLSDQLVKKKALSKFIPNFNKRIKLISDYMNYKSQKNIKWTFYKLNDPYGPAINDKELEYIVVSEETLPTAIEINFIRESKGLKPLKLVVIKMVKAKDKRPLRATRIRIGEVTEDGDLNVKLITLGDPL